MGGPIAVVVVAVVAERVEGGGDNSSFDRRGGEEGVLGVGVVRVVGAGVEVEVDFGGGVCELVGE